MTHHSLSDIVRLNVGGQHFETTRDTLVSSFTDSMLAHRFAVGNKYNVPKDGVYFFDRDGNYFRHILNALRAQRGLGPDLVPLSELKYWGLEALNRFGHHEDDAEREATTQTTNYAQKMRDCAVTAKRSRENTVLSEEINGEESASNASSGLNELHRTGERAALDFIETRMDTIQRMTERGHEQACIVLDEHTVHSWAKQWLKNLVSIDYVLKYSFSTDHARGVARVLDECPHLFDTMFERLSPLFETPTVDTVCTAIAELAVFPNASTTHAFASLHSTSIFASELVDFLNSSSVATTASATTASATTASATTASVTTASVTTASVTTESVTTASVTTESATTASTTTASVTTESATTASVTTESATTASVTTESVTTESATTAADHLKNAALFRKLLTSGLAINSTWPLDYKTAAEIVGSARACVANFVLLVQSALLLRYTCEPRPRPISGKEVSSGDAREAFERVFTERGFKVSWFQGNNDKVLGSSFEHFSISSLDHTKLTIIRTKFMLGGDERIYFDNKMERYKKSTGRDKSELSREGFMFRHMKNDLVHLHALPLPVLNDYEWHSEDVTLCHISWARAPNVKRARVE